MTDRLVLNGLGTLTLIDAGGTQGAVYAAPELRMLYAQSLVFKRYKPTVSGSLDVQVLDSMPAYLESLPFREGMELLSLAAWPCRLVDEGSTVIGFVMPHIPDAFFTQMNKASGISRERAEFQHLLNPESFLARMQINVTDRHRYKLLREAARALSVFHRHSIAVGDLSPKNLLYSCQPVACVYFVDCDSMRIKGRSAMDQAETPGWEVRAANPGEELGTAASDSYKLGLLALRLLAGSQDTHDPARLPASVPRAIRELVTFALSPDPARRPQPTAWIGPLDAAAAAASTAPPQARKPTAAAAPIGAGQPRTVPPRTANAPSGTAQPQIRRPPLTVARSQSTANQPQRPITPSVMAAAAPPARHSGGASQRNITTARLAAPKSAGQRSGRRLFLLSAGILALVAAIVVGTLVYLNSNTHPPGLIRAFTDPNPGTGGIQYLTFKPDSMILASEDANGGAYIWNSASGAGIGNVSPGGADSASALAFSPKGDELAVGGLIGKIYLRNSAATRRLGFFTDPHGQQQITALAFSPAGNALAAGDGTGRVYVWNLVNKRITDTFTDPSRGNTIETIAFSPGGNTIAIADGNGAIYLWKPSAAQSPVSLHYPHGSTIISSMAFNSGGTELATADDSGFAYLWNVADHLLTKKLSIPGISSLTFTPQGSELVTNSSDGMTLWQADLQSSKTIGVPGYCATGPVAITSDGSTLAVGCFDGHIDIWNMRLLNAETRS